MPIQNGEANLLTAGIPVDRHRIEEQNRILELITPGTFLDDALVSLVQGIEMQSPTGMRGSILLLDAGGKHLRHGAAPSLPDTYTAAIDGTAIGPAAGSCGTAAFTGETVIVSDISTDPLWADFRHLALEHGLHACWSTPIFSATGEILGTFAMYYDQPGSPSEEDRHLITFAARTAALLIERKRADEVQARLAAIVESSDDAIVSKDLNGIIMTWNAGAEHLFGYTAEEAIDQPITILIPPDRLDEEPEILRRIRRGERVDHFETVRRHKNGALVDISLTVSPVMDGRGRVVGASKIARDITERRILERQKDAFIGIAAHELRTPVTGIKAYTQLLARRMRKTDDAAALATLGKLEAQVDRLAGLISDMLDVTRMDGSDLPFRPAPFDLNQLLAEVIDETRQTTQHQIVAGLAAPVTLVGDRDRIAQVVTNLLTNAIKYSPQADRVVVRTSLRDEHVVIAVQDFGIGIPREDQPYIFDRFYRVTTNGRDGYAGLGLGLYIAAEFVKRHNGTIWVESHADQGTTIAFSLPLGESRTSQDADIE